MKKTNLEDWICRVEHLPELTRENLEALQLKRLNRTLSRLHERGGQYAAYPERLESLSALGQLPFTTPRMVAFKAWQSPPLVKRPILFIILYLHEKF